MNKIVKMKFGSHLYGTNTAESDLDYKGVFIAPYEDIILKRDKETIHQNTNKSKIIGEKNSKHDVDVEYKELRRFIYDAQQGQTYALDMLFAPHKMIEFSTDKWKYIILNRDKLLSKNVEPYIGYCRQQAGKYGLRGSRLGELLRVIDYFNKFSEKTRLEDVMFDLNTSEYVYIEDISILNNSDKTEKFLNVLGKKFSKRVFIKEVLKSLNQMNERYGERARMAMENKGIDWKAISHAYRCCYQLIELAETKNITFPLKNAEYIKSIKKGEKDYSFVQDELYELMEQAIEKIAKSDLPKNPEYEFWQEFILKTYK